MSDILNKILATKQTEVAQAKELLSLADIKQQITHAPAVRGFFDAITRQHALNKPAIIAEIKKASPSKGMIRADFDPVALAQTYEKNHAACLSILTDEVYFQGCAQYLIDAREAVSIPVLRKDFIVDEYQIYQARMWGADAVLLIAAALSTEQMVRFEQIAQDLGMSVLVEIHNKEQLNQIKPLETKLVGINNRDLRTFSVDLNTTLSLLPDIRNKTVVTESGIRTKEDVLRMQEHGVNSFLIGETFMQHADPGACLLSLYQ